MRKGIEVFPIKDEDVPLLSSYSEKLLYHFTDSNEARKILKSKKLRFNQLNRTNDPLEYKEYHSFFSMVPEISLGKYPQPMFGNSPGEIQFLNDYDQIINSEKKKYKVCCFCVDKNENPDPGFFNKGFGRSRMWGQYANNHKGVCIVFSKDKIIETIRKLYPGNFFEGEVLYRNRLPEDLESLREISRHDCTRLNCEAMKYFEENKEKLRKSLFYKFEDYRDENEFRIMIYENNEKSVAIDISKAIQAIIMGERISCRNKLWALCQELKINLYQIIWPESGPRVYYALR